MILQGDKKWQTMWYNIRILSFAVLISFTVNIISSRAATVAIMPVEDLSLGINSPNMVMTEYLAAELAAKGLRVVAEKDVIAFMTAERVRWLGYLETAQILKAKDALGADFILLGTVCQKKEKRSPTFGLSLQLVRTRDAETVWSTSGGLSLIEIQTLLHVNEPATLDELWPILVKNVLLEWPSGLGEETDQKLVFNPESGELPPVLMVKEVHLTPRYVKPGEQVKCVVRLDNDRVDSSVERPQVFIKVGSRIHLAQETREGIFYEASWTGSEVEKGLFREVGHESLKLAAADLNPTVFEGVWDSLVEEDTYPVSIILNWPTGERQTAYIGNYKVDNSPPETDMLIRGKVLHDMITFSDEITIVPKMKVREPLSHWKIHVEDTKGTILNNDEGSGNLPEKLFWRGTTSEGRPVKDGIYRLVLQVWDRAGNDFQTVQDVRYVSDPPDLVIDVRKKSKQLQVSLDRENKDIPLSFWYIEIWDEKGNLIQNADGSELPYSFDIPLPAVDKSGQIEGIVATRDILGNQTRMVVSDLYLMALQAEEAEEEVAGQPNETGNESVAWSADF